MAFTGAPTVKLVTDTLVRITGISLAHSANGTIGLHGNSGAPGVRLPAAFKPESFRDDDGNLVSLQDAISVLMVRAGVEAVVVPISVVKTGTTDADFLITLTNTQDANDSASLEIYVRNK
jgi:hypothetical protein